MNDPLSSQSGVGIELLACGLFLAQAIEYDPPAGYLPGNDQYRSRHKSQASKFIRPEQDFFHHLREAEE
jgi:hypothetical protein